ncbi:DMT family transporter [Metabacillus idriensis]|uniref:DMT family transporter n=1 Tax=Metabacillus idriensis TaxID=324768 RepID=UPI002813F0C5|nr:DMT family transporter [Metabacillus idriensis]MDR0139593.1 DMT family transporter [Metabacillus idriensis]
MTLLLVILPILAGIGLSIQSAINGTFGKKAGTIESAFLTFFTGAIFLTIVVNFFGKGNILAVTEVPKWQLLCAIFGVIYLSLMVLAVPKIGVTAAVVSVIIGQLTASMAIDHFGWFESQVIAFDLKRFTGIVLMAAALYFVFKGNKGTAENEKLAN